MRDTIKRLLKEQVNDRYYSIISNELDKLNAKYADTFGIDYESWRLGSEMLYKTQQHNPNNSWCIKWGTPEEKILVDKMSMISNVNDPSEEELAVCCDIIKRYYNFDTPLPQDDNSIMDLLSRKYFVTILDGTAHEYDERYGSEDAEDLHIGYEFNDYDDATEVGEGESDVRWFLQGWFKLNTEHANSIIYQWTYDQINSGNYNG